ncbi:hypothetical protein FQR65_LT09738 [Abscondita terminalis]|nr:hypothetical protein FQR65_LT09738 [Abscondita terminalis]
MNTTFKVSVHQPISQHKEIISELDEKENPLSKRELPAFNYNNNPFLPFSVFHPLKQEYPQVPNSQFLNYQKPIKVPVQELLPPLNPVENNPFISGSVSVPLFPPTSPPSTAAPSYVNNPFINNQHVNVAPPVTSKPIQTTPSYVNNPFIINQQVNTVPPSFPSTSKPEITSPSYVNNPFVNTQQLNNVPSSFPITSKPVVTTPSYVNNPFINTQQVNNAPSSFPITSKPVVTIPSYTNNPFLNVHSESVHTSFPVQITTTTTARPIVSTTQINSNNPFFNPAVVTSPPIINSPQEVPRQPVEPQIQPEEFNQLRSFCASARGQFPSGRCNTFVNCWDNVAVEQTCPPGLVFNYAGYCDYPQNVDCHGRSVEALAPQPDQIVPGVNPDTGFPDVTNTVPPVVYVPPPVDEKLKVKCLKPRGQFPSDSCNRYIDCWDDSVQEHECPEGLYFSEKGYCDYLYNVNCQNRTLQKSEVTQSSLCPQPEGYFRDKNNCSKYFVCINNLVAAQYECPLELYYNEVIGVCDYKQNVNCLSEPFVHQPLQSQNNLNQIPTESNVTPSSLCPKPDGYFRDKNNCSKYFVCINNAVAAQYACPEGLDYNEANDWSMRLQQNQVLHLKVLAEHYQMLASLSNISSHQANEPFVYQPTQPQDNLNQIPAGILNASQNCSPGKVFKLANDCSSAVLCRQGVTEVVYCPAGLAYDAPSDRCLPQQMAKW